MDAGREELGRLTSILCNERECLTSQLSLRPGIPRTCGLLPSQQAYAGMRKSSMCPTAFHLCLLIVCMSMPGLPCCL